MQIIGHAYDGVQPTRQRIIIIIKKQNKQTKNENNNIPATTATTWGFSLMLTYNSRKLHRVWYMFYLF